METLKNFHRRKTKVLTKENPDILAYETVPCIIECIAIIEVLKEYESDNIPPAWISLACCDNTHLNDGSLLKDALMAIDKYDQDMRYIGGIGINCCSGDYGKSWMFFRIEMLIK